MGKLLTSIATKDSRTDHLPDSAGLVAPTWTVKAGYEWMDWEETQRRDAHGQESDASEDTKDHNEKATTEHD